MYFLFSHHLNLYVVKKMLIFSQNPNPVSVSLIFQSNLNSKLSFITVSTYVTTLCFSIYSQWCFSIWLSTVFQHLLQHCVSSSVIALCFSIWYSTVFQHLLQHCVSASATALCFSICYSTVFQHLLQHCVSASVTALCFSFCYSTVFQHMTQHCVSAYTHNSVSTYDSALCFSI